MNEPPEPDRRHAWETRPAFRELFLLHAPSLAAEALREAGRHLYDALLETGLPERPQPWVSARVRALAEDLRFTGQVLASLGDAQVETALTRDEIALSIRAQRWAEMVEAVVRNIHEALQEAEEAR